MHLRFPACWLFLLAVGTCFTSPARAQVAPFEEGFFAGNAVNDLFGRGIALDGTTLAIGSPGIITLSLGSVHVYTRTGSDWTFETELLASDGLPGDVIGRELALEGDTLLVSSRGASPSGSTGAAYVFVRTPTGWVEEDKLISSDLAAFDVFGGRTLDLSGDTAILGAEGNDDNGNTSGSAYVFVRNGTSWSEQQKLLPSDGAAFDAFGFAVAVDGDTAVVSSYVDDDLGLNSGSVYVFERSGTLWTESAKLLAGDGTDGDRFGEEVSIHGDTIVVGASLGDGQFLDTGSVYVFVRDGAGWTQQAELFTTGNASPAPMEQFGASLDLDGDRLVVGAYANLVPFVGRPGGAFLFERSGTSWSSIGRIIRPDGADGDEFGWAVSLDGDRVAIGARFDDEPASDSGSASVYKLEGPTNYCTSAPNSVDANGALMGWTGSLSIQDNDFAVSAGPVPATFGLFYFGTETVTVPMGDGMRCVGGSTARLVPVSAPPSSGVVERAVDLMSTPASLMAPGAFWYFQYVYRDPAAGGAGLNTTDGLRVPLAP